MIRAICTTAFIWLVRALMSLPVWALGGAGPRHGARAWLVRAGIGVVLGILVRSFTVAQVDSSHRSPDPVEGGQHHHLLQMTTHEPEKFCAEVTDSPPSMSQADAFNRIWRALTQDNPAEDWNGIGDNRVGLAGNASPCTQQGFWPNILHFVDENGTGDPNFPNRAELFDDEFNGVTDHVEWRLAHVQLRAFDLQLDPEDGGIYNYPHIVNHEMGHVLGLRDGGPTAPLPEDRTTGCSPESIMHATYYGCSVNRDWPSPSDRSSVASMIPGGSLGGGGKQGFGLMA